MARDCRQSRIRCRALAFCSLVATFAVTALAVLEDLILVNDLDESASPFDYDDGDGVLEPW